MTADQTTTKMKRPECQTAQHVWIPDPDDPPATLTREQRMARRMAEAETAICLIRQNKECQTAQHVWIPDPDDPPLVAPYADAFCALLTGYALGAITVAAIGLIAWAVLR